MVVLRTSVGSWSISISIFLYRRRLVLPGILENAVILYSSAAGVTW